MARVAGPAALPPASALHHRLDATRQATAFLPDYGLKGHAEPSRAGTSLSGLVGGALTLLLVAAATLALKLRRRAA